MTVDAFPDWLAAVRLQLLASQDVADLVSTRGQQRVARWEPGIQINNTWSMPTNAITLTAAGGGEIDPYLGTPRVTMRCWGRTMEDAWALFRIAHNWLVVPTMPFAGRRSGFEQGGVKVRDVRSEGGYFRMLDPDTKWPLVLENLRVITWMGA